jgi:hypothetical protein
MTEIEQITITKAPPADDPPKKPISEAKLRANRENGAKSHGRVTPAGKRRSSLNAYRSGIHGQIVCATAEELEVFQKHTSDVLAEYEPVGPTENFFVSSISDNMWRIARFRARPSLGEIPIENEGFADSRTSPHKARGLAMSTDL